MEPNFKVTQDEVRIPPRIEPALVHLTEAIDYAEQSNSDHWEFAVELESLLALGLNLNDFRWLVRNGLVEHKREVTLECDDGRSFRETGDLRFPSGTCFVLTAKGITLSRQGPRVTNGNGKVSIDLARHDAWLPQEKNGSQVRELTRPCWDSERRVLTFSGTIVKQFKWVAENQEAILSAFEEEGWPSRIYDPLKPCPEQDPKRRLSDTIKCLNRKQSKHLIHFRGDGTGEGVIWEVATMNGANPISTTQS